MAGPTTTDGGIEHDRHPRGAPVLTKGVMVTVQINLREFAWALVPAVALLALWELGKLIARRGPAVSG